MEDAYIRTDRPSQWKWFVLGGVLVELMLLAGCISAWPLSERLRDLIWLVHLPVLWLSHGAGSLLVALSGLAFMATILGRPPPSAFMAGRNFSPAASLNRGWRGGILQFLVGLDLDGRRVAVQNRGMKTPAKSRRVPTNSIQRLAIH